MVGWHPRINGREFERALGDGEGQGSLECCSLWGCKELGRTEQLNSNVKGASFPFTVVLMEEGIRPPH